MSLTRREFLEGVAGAAAVVAVPLVAATPATRFVYSKGSKVALGGPAYDQGPVPWPDPHFWYFDNNARRMVRVEIKA